MGWQEVDQDLFNKSVQWFIEEADRLGFPKRLNKEQYLRVRAAVLAKHPNAIIVRWKS